MTAKRTPGVYHLILRLPRASRIRVGRLGLQPFGAGYYVYTGSAMNGLEARVARHRRRRKRLRWHIDYLLQKAEMAAVVLIPTRRRLECARNCVVLSLPGASIPVAGFGSSDCRCRSHLVYFGEAQPVIPPL